MIITRYAVCSETNSKPVTRLVCDTKPEAEKALARIKAQDENAPEEQYWIAELGAESEAWRWFAADAGK